MTSAGDERRGWPLGWNLTEAIVLAIVGVGLLWLGFDYDWRALWDGAGRSEDDVLFPFLAGLTDSQLAAYWSGLAAAVLLITLKAASALRDRTVTARRRRQGASWRTGAVVIGALAASAASLLNDQAPPYALTALAVGLVIGGAEHLGKSAFRRATAIVGLAGLVALAAAGHQASQVDPADTPAATAPAATTTETTDTSTATTATTDTEQTTESTESTEAADTPETASTVEVVQLVRRGLDHALSSLHQDLGGTDPAPVFGPWGYLLLGLLLILAHRWLEVRNNRQYGAPIEVVEIAGLKEDDRGPLTQRLRERILDSGISDPGPIPGITTGTELSKLLAEAEVPHNKLAQAALSAIQTVAFPPAGVKVVTTVTSTADDTLEASVELSTRAEGRYVESRILTAEDQTALVDAVAGFVATNALNYSRATPPWAKWHDTTGQSLLRYQRIQDDRAGPRPALSMEEARTQLESALRASPGNALVRLALGHQYDLEGHRLQAMHLHLLTCTDYPTMLNSRYRLATSLLMTSDPRHLNTHWLPGAPLRATVITLLCERYPTEHRPPEYGIEESIPDLRGALESPQPRRVSQALRTLAVRELEQLLKMLSPRTLLWLAGRPAERVVMTAVLRDRVERIRRRSTYRTVLILTQVRLALATDATDPPNAAQVERLEELRDELDTHAAWSSSSSPTAHYNAACVHGELALNADHPAVRESRPPARPSDLDEGFRHLEEALRRGGRVLFAREWLQRDPDLAPLRAEKDRFAAVLDTLTTPGPPERPDLEGTP